MKLLPVMMIRRYVVCLTSERLSLHYSRPTRASPPWVMVEESTREQLSPHHVWEFTEAAVLKVFRETDFYFVVKIGI